MKTKKLEIGGKIYTFTTRKSLAKVLAKISPSVLKLNQDNDEKMPESLNEEETQGLAVDFGLDLYDNLDVLFYEMIRIAHPMDKDTCDKIFEKCCEEYGDAQLLNALLDFALSAFPQGSQEPKKKIVW